MLHGDRELFLSTNGSWQIDFPARLVQKRRYSPCYLITSFGTSFRLLQDQRRMLPTCVGVETSKYSLRPSS